MGLCHIRIYIYDLLQTERMKRLCCGIQMLDGVEVTVEDSAEMNNRIGESGASMPFQVDSQIPIHY